MAGRGRLAPSPILPGRGPVGGTLRGGGGAGLMGPGTRAGCDILPPTAAMVEEKLAIQHIEIQKLLSENQRLAATHVALRQELASSQREIQRLQQALAASQLECDQEIRGLTEKLSKLEAELRSLEPLKVDLQKSHTDIQKLFLSRQELSAQVHQLTQELQRSKGDNQKLPTLKAEVETLLQEIQHVRNAFEYEKNANAELLEQRTVMEKNLVSMAREVEKLRAELTNSDKKFRAGSYGGAYGPESGYPSVPSYTDGYGLGQMGSAIDGGVNYAAGSVPPWNAYEAAQRGGVPHSRK